MRAGRPIVIALISAAEARGRGGGKVEPRLLALLAAAAGQGEEGVVRNKRLDATGDEGVPGRHGATAPLARGPGPAHSRHLP